MGFLPVNATGHESADDIDIIPGAQHIQKLVKRDLFVLPGIQNATGPADLLSVGAGTPALSEINSSEICGFACDAGNESYGCLWCLPDEIDLSEDIDFRVLWGDHTTGGSGTATWSVVYTPLAFNTTALAVGGTALDTIVAADAPSTTDYCLQATEWGTLDGATLSASTYVPGESALAIKVYFTGATITAGYLFGLQSKFRRKYIG